MRREEHIHESQGGQRLRAHPQVRGHLLGQLLSHQSREQCPRRGRRAHLDDGRGALRRRGGRRLLARHLREADRRVHGDGEPERGGHPDGLRRIAQAWEDSSPVLVIAEGVGQGASRHTHFDMAEAFRSVTKWVGKVDRADLIPDYVRRAFTHLRSGRPGPVLLLIPRDLGEYEADEHPYTPVKGWRSGPDLDDVKAAIRVLLAAEDPLLHVGEGVLYADAAGELLRFAEQAQVPVLTTLKAKGVFPENHPLSVGVRGSLADHFLHKADVLFAVGSSLFPNRFSHAIPGADKKTIVQCTVDTLDINRSYETSHAVI